MLIFVRSKKLKILNVLSKITCNVAFLQNRKVAMVNGVPLRQQVAMARVKKTKVESYFLEYFLIFLYKITIFYDSEKKSIICMYFYLFWEFYWLF